MEIICLLLEQDWFVDNLENSDNILLTWHTYKAVPIRDAYCFTYSISTLLFKYTISNTCLKVILDIYCSSRLISSKMLSQYLCQPCKCLFLRNLRVNSVNGSSLARRIHSSSKKLSDSESKEQTVQKCETEELPQSTGNSDFGRLHIPVMLEEVVNCLAPQPGQVS